MASTVFQLIFTVPTLCGTTPQPWTHTAGMFPATWDEFLAACPAIQDEGMTPLVVAAPWTVNHLWESVALGVLGAEGWAGIWSGDIDPAGEEMAEVWDTFGAILECTNIDDDAAGLSWQQATDRVVGSDEVRTLPLSSTSWVTGLLVT